MPYSFNPFTGNFDAVGVVSAGAFDNTSNANGITVSGSVINLHAADNTNPGALTVSAQTIGGDKTFSGAITANKSSGNGLLVTANALVNGSLLTQTVDAPSATFLNIGGGNANTVNIGNSSTSVNILGTLTWVNTTNLQVTDELITVNHGGAAGSATAAGVEVEENAIITGYAKTGNSRNSWLLKAPNTAGIATITPGAGGITLDQSSHNPITLTAVGASPNANAASLATQALTLQPADSTNPGVLSAGTQSIGGNKTFTGTIAASNISGTNTGDVTLTAVGSAPNANGASLSGQALTLQPADGTNPGLLTSGSQTIGGDKTLNGSAFVLTNLSVGTTTTTSSTPVLVQESGVASDQSIKHDVYATSNSGGFTGRRARGTLGSPTAAQSGDNLSFFSGFGYGATGFPANSTGNISFTAAQAFTDSAQGTHIDFKNAPNGSLTKATNLRIAQSGNLLVGTTTDNATDKLQVNGSASASSLAITNGITSATLNTTGTITGNHVVGKSFDLIGSSSGTLFNTVPAAVTDYTLTWPSANGATNTTIRNDGTGILSWVTLGSAGDISETTFSLANNQSAAANVTGLAFSNSVVRSALITYSIVISATTSLYESGQIQVVQKGSSWEMAQSTVGDNSLVVFSITTAGQVQYTDSNYSGFTSGKLAFKAITTSV